jgi:hypothetical protein
VGENTARAANLMAPVKKEKSKSENQQNKTRRILNFGAIVRVNGNQLCLSDVWNFSTHMLKAAGSL